MAKIAFVVCPYLGSMISSMKLADELRKKGNTVFYVGIEDSEDYIKSHGFKFHCVFREYFPRGYISEWKKFSSLPLGIEYIRIMRKMGKTLARFINDLIKGESGCGFISTMKNVEPDIMVLSSSELEMEWIAIMAYSLGIPCVYFSDMLIPCEICGFPPLSSDLIPSRSLWRKFRIYIAWRYYNFIEIVLHILSILVRGVYLGNFSKRLSRKFECPWHAVNNKYDGRHSVRLPELVSFPLDFDFPGANLPGRYYIGTSIYLKRNKPEFPWDKLTSDRPLIYCALGSILPSGSPNKISYILRTFIQSANVKNDWQWVISTGEAARVDGISEIPDNVIVVKNAPQIDILRRANMMVTHGGANTIKECMYIGVPMILLTSIVEPLALIEIPAYTARVVYHGLGMAIDIKKLNTTCLCRTINILYRDPYIQSQVRIMQNKIKRLEEECLDVKLIEAILECDAVVY